MSRYSSSLSRPPAASASSRPNSGYEDLSLDEDEDPTTSALGPVDDPWGAPANKESRHFSPSYPPAPELAGYSLGGEAGPSRPAAVRSPPSTSAASVLSLPTSIASSVSGAGGYMEVNDVTHGPVVLGVAVVDFNHLIGPTVEWAHPPNLMMAIQDDEALGRLLPFLALPDGAHLSEEDYSYFHCLYSPTDSSLNISNVPSNVTLFGISCNRQLAAADLLRRPSDVTRSTVQKAVVVIASQPIFGPIRDKLGVVTRAYFAQRDFTQTDILEDFYGSLEDSIEDKATEAAIYIGTNLRELIHKFRHRTLVLLKMLMLQKRVMLYGYPVEKLCTYQYSLVSLIPGLLLSLQDCGSPSIRKKDKRERPTSLRSSDRTSLLRYMGLPLQLFTKDAFFQPYLPLQQVEMLAASSWLVGTTNQIVTQQKDCKYDLLVNIDTMTFEFTDPKIERTVALTSADRKWMDEVVRTVEETYNVSEHERSSFRGSDDDLRSRFEEYICAALASIKYAEFLSKAQPAAVAMTAAGGEGSITEAFSSAWLNAFKRSPAGHTWEARTDPGLFDICEPKHPCDGQPNMVSDLSLRLSGIHDLKLDSTLNTGKEALTSAWTAGSTTLFKAFDGVRNEVSTRLKEREEADRSRRALSPSTGGADPTTAASPTPGTPGTANGNPGIGQGLPQLKDVGATLGGIGAGIGGFFGSRVASFRGTTSTTPGGTAGAASKEGSPAAPKNGLRPMSLSKSASAGSLSRQAR